MSIATARHGWKGKVICNILPAFISDATTTLQNQHHWEDLTIASGRTNHSTSFLMLFQLRKVGSTKAVQNMKRVSMSYINFELAVRLHEASPFATRNWISFQIRTSGEARMRELHIRAFLWTWHSQLQSSGTSGIMKKEQVSKSSSTQLNSFAGRASLSSRNKCKACILLASWMKVQCSCPTQRSLKWKAVTWARLRPPAISSHDYKQRSPWPQESYCWSQYRLHHQ